MLNSRKKIILSIAVLAIIFLALIGVTYAYYAAIVNGNTSGFPSLSLKSGFIAIEYTDGKTSINNEGLATGTTGDLVLTKTFSVENTGASFAYYGVWIKNYEVLDASGNATTFSRPQDWSYELKAGNMVISSGQLPNEDKALLTARGLSKEVTEQLTLTVTYNYITSEEAESMGATINDVNQTADQNKALSFDVSVIQSVSSFDNAEEGTLLYAIGQDNIENNTFLADVTIPGQAVSTEAILSTGVEDDYGTSYYFRGNVTNNYVNYSGMCWRIVRVDGNGNIKLVLADDQNECNDGYSLNNSSSAFIKDGSTLKIVGYNPSPRGIESFSFASSEIPAALSDWASQMNLSTSDLFTSEWCNDVSIGSVEKEGEVKIYTFGAAERLSSPSLKCPQQGINNMDNIYVNTLGLLNADEILFAGSAYNAVSSYYLQANAEDTNVDNYGEGANWTLSVARIGLYDDGSIATAPYVLALTPQGKIIYDDIDRAGVVRPTIVLKSTALATTNSDTNTYGQPGTYTNPYDIQ